MAKQYITIELTESELGEIVAEKYNLKSPKVNIQKYDGDQRDPSYTRITITSEIEQEYLVDLEDKFRKKISKTF